MLRKRQGLNAISRCLGTIAAGLILLGGVAWGQEIIIAPSMPGTPSIDQGGVYCYDIRTFELLDCHFTYTLSRGINDGGHLAHSTPRPIGGLRFPGGDETFLSLSINTRRSVVEIEYLAPEASGGVNLTITNTPPEGYKCVFSCFEERKALVGIEGLVRLEDTGPHHLVLRGLTSTHPEGTYGTPETIETLKEIAEEYFDLTDGRKLSVNDISLPMGGLFDYKATWAPPHFKHRKGTNADINQKGGVPCNGDEKLKKAVNVVAKRRPGTQLQCENTSGKPDPNGPFKHINFN